MARKYTRRETFSFLAGLALVVVWSKLPFLEGLFQNPNNTVAQVVTEMETLTQASTVSTSVPLLMTAYDAGGIGTQTQTTTTAASNDIYQIVNAAVVAGVTSIHLTAGSYICSDTVLLNNIPNLEIYGDGQDVTIIKLNPALYKDMFEFLNCNNLHIHDLQIDGNRTNQITQSTTEINGIAIYGCDNVLIEKCYVHDCRVFGIEVAFNNVPSTNVTIQNNIISYCDANGININQVRNNNSTPAGILVQNNTVSYSSDVGITNLGGRSWTCTGNTVSHVDQSLSPFNVNSHIGIAASEGSANPNPAYQPPPAGNSNPAVTNNTISACYVPNDPNNNFGIGIWANGGLQSGTETLTTFTITGNNISGCKYGLDISNAIAGATIQNNTFGGLPDKNSFLIYITAYNPSRGGAPNNIDITENNIGDGVNPPGWGPGSFLVRILDAANEPPYSTGSITNNTVNAGGQTSTFLVLSAFLTSEYWTTTPNTIVVPEFPSGDPIALSMILAAVLLAFKKRSKAESN